MADGALPGKQELEQLLGRLLGRTVTASPAAERLKVAANPTALATYTGKDDSLVALCACDIPLACSMGAALSLFPPGRAQQAIKSGELSEELKDNIYEVLNITSRLFNTETRPHCVLKDVSYLPQEKPSPEALMKSNAKTRLDVNVDVEDYGRGRLSLVFL